MEDGTTVDSEIHYESLQLRDSNNEEDDKSYSSHVYAVLEKMEDGTTVESEINDECLQLRDNNNEEDDNSYSSHVYAVVNEKEDQNGSPIPSPAATAVMNDDEMTVQDEDITVWM